MGNIMGTVCSVGEKLANGMLAPDEDADEDFMPGITPVHMLVCAIDYKGTSAPLTCTQDGDNIIALARQCGISDITYMKDNQCTKEGVLGGIRQVGATCNPGDYFIFFYAGHGANIPDDDGDEPDGQDEALCTVTADGNIDFDAFVRDDEFAATVVASVPQGTNVLVLCDCCHSGTIGDFGHGVWGGHYALSMSGCKDDQTSGDTGKGGIWTHSCLIAIEELQKEGKTGYSCAQLYNMQLEKDNKVFNSAQDIMIKWSTDLGGPQNMAWPLIPLSPYKAPWYQMTPKAREMRLQ
mmetsp:Transcript_149957/g.272699  ORF Transcript_149957/g.272699 Transcript_149957/m.272699 type:complete len:294 (+) Transcript_149957:92-973(+)